MTRSSLFRKRHKGYAKTELQSGCGSLIICRSCDYQGPADVILSTVLGSGEIERCPLCRSLNFCREGEADCVEKAVQLSFVF